MVRILALNLTLFISGIIYGQNTDVDHFDKSFVKLYFETNNASKICKTKIHLRIKTDDTLAKPVKKELQTGLSNSIYKTVEAKVKIKKTEKKIDVKNGECYFLCRYSYDDSTSISVEQYELIEKEIGKVVEMMRKDTLNHFILSTNNTKGKTTYFGHSSNVFTKISVRFKLKDRFFLRKRGVDVEKLKERTIQKSLDSIGYVNEKKEIVKLFKCE